MRKREKSRKKGERTKKGGIPPLRTRHNGTRTIRGWIEGRRKDNVALVREERKRERRAKNKERKEERKRRERAPFAFTAVLFNPVGYFRRDLTLVFASLSLINNKTPRQKCVVNCTLRQKPRIHRPLQKQSASFISFTCHQLRS